MGCAVAASALVALLEFHASPLQSLYFASGAGGMRFTLADGPSATVGFPQSGPYDWRLGYKQLPQYIQALTADGYLIQRQARMSPTLARFTATGGYALYDEKNRAGLTILDRDGQVLFARRFPERGFERFEDVPKLLVDTLLFIEDRQLLRDAPWRNPAVDWTRLGAAISGQFAGLVDVGLRRGGASTLATQIEKFRHSPGGYTHGVGDKLRQMIAASYRAYLDGGDTRQARRRIVVNYLNATPLGGRAQHGEVIGLADGLWAWYGIELQDAVAVLNATPADDEETLARRGRVYRHALSLMLAQRRPAYYFGAGRGALEDLCDLYLRLLDQAGVIDPELRSAALAARLEFAPPPPLPARDFRPERKAADALRIELLRALDPGNLDALDHLDLSVHSTIDATAQRRVSTLLERLSDRSFVRAKGLVGRHLLGDEDVLERVEYSVVLFERDGGRNLLRVRADSLERPFDLNGGARLVLGSTAKLRTLITYLNVIAELHARLAPLTPAELETAARRTVDPLSQWACARLQAAPGMSLEDLLAAAMQRRYSASPHETFFTGGGLHVFHNFQREENRQSPTVEDAFRRSVNLVFVRMMRDLTRYYVARSGLDLEQVLGDRDDASRKAYLMRFADREGRVFLDRFLRSHRGLSAEEALRELSEGARSTALAQTVVFRSVAPLEPVEALDAFLRQRLGTRAPSRSTVQSLYRRYAPQRFPLNDRGFLARVHPLELWLVGYLRTHPQATRAQVHQASWRERQEVYRWLFRTRSSAGQNARIRTLLEIDAFSAILEDWRAQGYPFGRLVPSLATAIGSSGDRPDALAELMGVIVNDGQRLPTTDIDELRFAEATPYETHLVYRPATPPRQVLKPEVARTVRRALEGVVSSGTAVRLRGAYRAANCELMSVGGKTGTSDERFKTFGAGRQLVHSRAVNRTAAFVFFLGDRFFGTITVYVPGPESARFHFTSSFAVQLLKLLAPELRGLTGGGETMAACGAEAK